MPKITCKTCGAEDTLKDGQVMEYCQECRRKMDDSPGTLRPDEHHPSADNALAWIKATIISDPLRYLQIKESMASCAIEYNRTAEICLDTLNRLANDWPVSDRYILGLAWFLRRIIEGE